MCSRGGSQGRTVPGRRSGTTPSSELRRLDSVKMRDYRSYQVARVPELDAFDPKNVADGPVHVAEIDGFFPTSTRGGLVDARRVEE